MKITAIILLSACLTAAATGHGQQITLTQKDATLEQVFSEIKKQSGYTFFYADNLLHNAKKVTISTRDASIEEVLDIVFKDQPLTYSIIDKADKFVVIKSKEPVIARSDEGATKQAPPAVMIDIKGRITNEDGEPVAASIIVKGTQQGTTSNTDGYFELKGVDENATLLITGISIEKLEIKVNGRKEFNFSAKTKVTSLNEVIINKGYYSEKQKYSTSNVSRVTAKDIEKQPVSNPLLALQGRVPGLFIEQTTGVPGSGVKVRIQGQTSLASGSDPLYVIDGIPYTQQLIQGFNTIQGNSGVSPSGNPSGNPLSYINPNDIESIDVLKDADATAIYGSRAAAGAILITTKKGKSGKTRFDLNIQNGWGKVPHFVKLLNTQQYLEMRLEAKANDNTSIVPTDYDLNGTWEKNRFTDWQKVLIGGTAKYSDAQLSISGGSAKTSFLIAGNYHKETTVFPGDLEDIRSSFHINTNHSSADNRFQIQFDGKYISDNNQLSLSDLTSTAVNLPPNSPSLYNIDGTLNWAQTSTGVSTWLNPLAYLNRKYKGQVRNLIMSWGGSLQLAKNLILKANFGYTNLARREMLLIPLTGLPPEIGAPALRQSSFGNDQISSWNIEPQLTYKTSKGKGNFDALVGLTYSKRTSFRQDLSASGFSSDLLIQDIRSATTVTASSPLNFGDYEYKYNALFGRIGYNWDNKYIVNLTARRDGSSRFGSNNLFNNFWSVGGAWLFSNEHFLKANLPFLSFGKLRASYGTSGNDQIGDYQFMNLYGSQSRAVPYQGVTGLFTSTISNEYLQWEETKKLQTGLAIGFWDDRILLDATYYSNRSSNQLQPYQLPTFTGATSITINFPATIQNYGWELSFTTNPIRKKDFDWTSSINLTIPKNKLVAYNDLEKSSYTNTYIIGEPFTIRKFYHFNGIDPATGLFIYQDNNGNVTFNPIQPEDNFVVLNVAQKVYGGFQNNVSFKGFSLDFLFQFVKQKGLDYTSASLNPGFFRSSSNGALNGNQPISVLDQWQKPGDIATFQRFSASNPIILNYTSSDARIVNTSYVRLKNISLSWQIPATWKKRIGFQNIRVYAQGQNIFTITKYKGLDPETMSSSTLPPLRTVTVGIQMTL